MTGAQAAARLQRQRLLAQLLEPRYVGLGQLLVDRYVGLGGFRVNLLEFEEEGLLLLSQLALELDRVGPQVANGGFERADRRLGGRRLR